MAMASRLLSQLKIPFYSSRLLTGSQPCRRNAFPVKTCTPVRLISATSFRHSNPIQQTVSDDNSGPSEGKRDVIFTKQHDEIRELVKKLIDTDINPFVDEWEEIGQFPAHQVFKKFGDAGLLGLNRPEEYGGMGLDFSYNMAMAEELGRINSGGVSSAFGVHTDMATPAFAKYGTHELKKSFLEPAIRGDMVACVGVSEVEAGSDVANIKTSAVRKGDDFVINGHKMWITNGAQADWICLLCNTEKDQPKHLSKSLIIVPKKTPGVTVAKKILKLGNRSSDTAQIFFEDVKVPQSHLLGDPGMGFIYQMEQFQEERLWSAASCLLAMDRVIQHTADYCRDRKAFGVPVLSNQIVYFTLAELQSEVEALRALVYRAVANYLQGDNVTLLASMCKLKAGRLTRIVGDKCLQFWGGMGYTEEVLVSRFYRDTRALSIAGGSDEIMLQIIAKSMGIIPERVRK
ncbi:probable acyl-CoA dehydrogenase 6 [Paramacrobiotus metropolitanus]|uniref:probable acyl-CoA dehydrogenase 6 n=1 Tax=Paramacrobiotus metropolitanus TaxID=2943436 RepID=UPI002445E881|nr:probable acyl-CoA dehydrogenase 6 [Paramacrobiotus metropolitanus]